MADVNLDKSTRTLYRLYISFSGPDDSDQNIAKLSAVISEVFESYTMISAIGSYQKQFEETTIIEIAVTEEKEKYIFAAAEMIRDQFALEAVGICKVGDYMRVIKHEQTSPPE